MNRYPTDEELNSFIEELEKEELYAPAHLKGEILQRIEKESRQADAESKRGQPVSLVVYTLKIAIGMAAAMLFLFIQPVRDGSNVSWAKEDFEPKERISDTLREKREHIENRIEHWLNQLEDGGKDNEN